MRAQIESEPTVSPIRLATHLRLGSVLSSGLDFEAALRAADSLGWDVFPFLPDRRDALRESINILVQKQRPYWARRSAFGRDQSLTIITPNARQCLRNAGLLGPLSDQYCSSWWKNLSASFSDEIQKKKTEVGELAEFLSLELEKSRMRAYGIERVPEHVSVQDSLAGFDIRSYRMDSSLRVVEVMIEVKGFQTSNSFFLSSREWKVASENQTSYHFHIWNLQQNKMQEFTPNEIAEHIPANRGRGRWKVVRIRLGFWKTLPSVGISGTAK